MNEFGLLMSVYFRDCPIHLATALESCDFSRLSEVVIVSDGPVSDLHISTIKDKVPQNLLKLILLKENKGLGVALNYGLKECTADYIFRMDSDDVCVNDRFLAQIEYINLHGCDVLGGHIDEFNTVPGIVISKRCVPLDFESISKALLRRNSMNHVTVCFNRRKVIDIGSYQNVIYHEDYDLWIRAVATGLKIENMDKVLVQVRTGNGFLSRRHGFNYLFMELKFVLKNVRFFRFSSLEYMLIRCVFRLGPKFILNFFYSKFLRNN